jgi:hypothetical protein
MARFFFIKYTAQIQVEEKARDLAVKDQIQKEKLDEAASPLAMATSAMNHQNYALPGSTFPPPTPTQSHLNNNNTISGVSIPCLIFILEKTSLSNLTNCTFATTATTKEYYQSSTPPAAGAPVSICSLATSVCAAYDDAIR